MTEPFCSTEGCFSAMLPIALWSTNSLLQATLVRSLCFYSAVICIHEAQRHINRSFFSDYSVFMTVKSQNPNFNLSSSPNLYVWASNTRQNVLIKAHSEPSTVNWDVTERYSSSWKENPPFSPPCSGSWRPPPASCGFLEQSISSWWGSNEGTSEWASACLRPSPESSGNPRAGLLRQTNQVSAEQMVLD